MKQTDTYQYKTELWLPVTIHKAWEFFSSPMNLRLITPPELDFKILTPITTGLICNGMQINYLVKPIFKIPVIWETEILDVNERKKNTDRQLKGPYRLWEHTDYFNEQNGGVLMTDEVNYQLSKGILGKMIHQLIVRKRIESIFEYKKQMLNKIFTAC